MKQAVSAYLVAVATLLLVGCGSGEPKEVVFDQNLPLSVQQWKTLDVGVKYELETLERLRQSDPKLKSERSWARFMKKVVVPQRRTDIPTDY